MTHSEQNCPFRTLCRIDYLNLQRIALFCGQAREAHDRYLIELGQSSVKPIWLRRGEPHDDDCSLKRNDDDCDRRSCFFSAGVPLLCGYVTVAYFYAIFTLWRSPLSSNK